MNPLWKRILDLDFQPGQSKHQVIARAIRTAILDKSLPLGSSVPPYRKIADHLQIDNNIVTAAWKELRDAHELITTSRSKGTFVVSELPKKKGIKVSPETADTKFFNPRKLQFDQETILPFDNVIKGLDSTLYKGSRHYTHLLSSRERKLKVLPALVNQLRNMINNVTACSYAEEELYYSEGYEPLIYHICAILLPARSIFVMTSPASVMVKNAVNAAGRKTAFIDAGQSDISIENLDMICSTTKVGIVHLSSRSVYPVYRSLNELTINRLLALQRKYKFVIIEDDRHAGFYRKTPNLLMEMVYRSKAKVIYLRPVSFIHPDLHTINIMAAPAKLTAEISNKFRHTGKSFSAAAALSLNDLIEKKILYKYESKVLKTRNEVVKKAVRILRESELWKADGLMCNKGYFFYLELRKGILPGNIVDLLAQSHIYVMDPADYAYDPALNNRISISIAAYMDDKHLVNDLDRMHDFIRELSIDI